MLRAPTWSHQWQHHLPRLDDSTTICCVCQKPGKLVVCNQCQFGHVLPDLKGRQPESGWWSSSHQLTSRSESVSWWPGSARSPANPCTTGHQLQLFCGSTWQHPGPNYDPHLPPEVVTLLQLPQERAQDVGSTFKQVNKLTEGKVDVQSLTDLSARMNEAFGDTKFSAMLLEPPQVNLPGAYLSAQELSRGPCDGSWSSAGLLLSPIPHSSPLIAWLPVLGSPIPQLLTIWFSSVWI